MLPSDSHAGSHGAVPASPKLYHITHVNNVARIIEAGRLWSDAKRIELGLGSDSIGMSAIKQRRVDELQVSCYPETRVGQYVPFYFCPRSIMLYILHRGNHVDIDYRGGQEPIIHLQLDMHATIVWAESQGEKQWVFTDGNAGARLASFYNDLRQLSNIDWKAVQASDFREPSIKEGKQAEFLAYDFVPWALVEKIGVINQMIESRVKSAIQISAHKPQISVERSWYF
ncbi:MAG: DUF4433 domain-containing protein [Nitrospinae bacterium]|nr:DUF4433 domain-containing protein [Nitrospinota bacterium]